MYLRRLRVKNLKLVEDLTLDFTRKGQPRMLTVLIGENGTCKTSILQAIALATNGRAIAERVGSDVAASWPHVDRPNDAVEILAEFQMGPIGHSLGRVYPGWSDEDRRQGPPRVSGRLRLPGGKKDFVYSSWYGPWDDESLDVLTAAMDGPIGAIRSERELQPHWFVAAYGVSRRLPVPGGAPAIKQPAEDRIRPLFDLREVTGTGFSDAFNTRDDDQDDDSRSKKGEAARLFARIINDAIKTDVDLVPNIEEIDLRGHGGARSAARLAGSHRFVFVVDGHRLKLPATWLSYGYQSTLAWISDLIGWVLWEAREGVAPESMEGIVLIDELDLHLHPTWQVRLARALTKVFPKLQFITTTHSPTLLAGLDDDEIIRLGTQDGEVVQVETGGSPRSSTGTELLADHFGIDRLITNPAGDDLWRYAELATNPYRTDEEDAEMRRLRERLKVAKIDPKLEPEPRAAAERNVGSGDKWGWLHLPQPGELLFRSGDECVVEPAHEVTPWRLTSRFGARGDGAVQRQDVVGEPSQQHQNEGAVRLAVDPWLLVLPHHSVPGVVAVVLHAPVVPRDLEPLGCVRASACRLETQ